jgi:hypothetical protein
MGQYPFFITGSAINRAEWETVEFCNLRRVRPPSLPWMDGEMEGRMDDRMDDGTDGWKGRPTPTTTGQNLKYYISRHGDPKDQRDECKHIKGTLKLPFLGLILSLTSLAHKMSKD